MCVKVALSHINANPDGELCPPSWLTGRSTWLPFGARTSALAPLVWPSKPSWMPRQPALAQHPPTRSASLSHVSDGRGAITIAVESFASSVRRRPRVVSPLRASLSPPRAPPSSPPLGRQRSPRGEPHFSCFPSSGSRPSRPQLWRTSPLLHPSLLSSI